MVEPLLERWVDDAGVVLDGNRMELVELREREVDEALRGIAALD